MTVPAPENQEQITSKELNFRNLEARYQRELAAERQARMDVERQLQERSQKEEVEENAEPYVDHKKLEKKLARFSEQNQKQTQTEIQKAVQQAITEERQNNWLKSNPDFGEVLTHAEKLAQHDPELADSILDMPDTFERKKLVYKNIKALGLHKAPEKAPSIQEKIDANRKSPFYQPSGTGSSPYVSQGDFSAGGQKQAYDKIQELKARLRV